VMMAMGDTPRVTFKGQDGIDVIPSMTGETPRNYLLFKHSRPKQQVTSISLRSSSPPWKA